MSRDKIQVKRRPDCTPTRLAMGYGSSPSSLVLLRVSLIVLQHPVWLRFRIYIGALKSDWAHNSFGSVQTNYQTVTSLVTGKQACVDDLINRSPKLSASSYFLLQSNSCYDDISIFYRHNEDIVVTLGGYHINSRNPWCRLNHYNRGLTIHMCRATM